MKIKNDKIVYSKQLDSKGNTGIEIFFADFFDYETGYIPLEIKTILYKNNEIYSIEEIKYCNLLTNIEIPDSVLTFTLPKNIEIIHRKW